MFFGKNLKKTVLCVVFIILFLMLALSNSNYVKAKKYLIVSDKMQAFVHEYYGKEYEIKECKTINDLLGNDYFVCDLNPSGYMLWDGKSDLFIEGSIDGNNPFCLIDTKNARYLGYGNYFNLIDDKCIDILNCNIYDINHLNDENIEFRKKIEERVTIQSMQQRNSKAGDNSYVDEDGFVLINDDLYFKNLWFYPNNNENSCGYVALSILLGYLDTYKSDDTLPDSMLINGIDCQIMYKMSINNTYLPVNANLNTSYWPYSPTTSDSLKLLLMNYGYSIFNSYPSSANNIIDVFESFADDYIYDNTNYICDYQSTPGVGNFIKDKVDSGIPVITCMLYFEYNNNHYSFVHDVVVFGYKNDIFMAHSGWNNGYHIILLNNILFDDAMTIEYLGNHSHSSNYQWEKGECTGTFCPCGYYVCHHESQTYYEITGNDFNHNRVCNACNLSVFTHHNYILENNSYRCINCSHIVNYCPHDYVYNGIYNLNIHKLECNFCGNIYNESHIYRAVLGGYECVVCGYFTTKNPGGIIRGE
ncbi:MAG: hypothetical protein IJS58_00820 [Bacilli bacterium]|nr:hypothetical protein [Bacilli bacterium]